MKTHIRIAIASSLLMTLVIVPMSHFALGDPPRTAIPNDAAPRTVPPIPTEASHAHNIRLRVLKVTPIERIDKTQILKLEVERWYGKVDTKSLNRAKEHETQRFTILFPASLDADIRPGDLVNYWLVGYTAIGRQE